MTEGVSLGFENIDSSRSLYSQRNKKNCWPSFLPPPSVPEGQGCFSTSTERQRCLPKQAALPKSWAWLTLDGSWIKSNRLLKPSADLFAIQPWSCSLEQSKFNKAHLSWLYSGVPDKTNYFLHRHMWGVGSNALYLGNKESSQNGQ